MNKKIILSCVFIVLIVIVIMTGGFLLKPIAKVGNDTVRMYEFIGYAVSDNQIILERTAEKLAFKRIIEETNVTVSEAEIQTELNAMNTSDISYETCRKSMLQQKVIEKYASEVTITANAARIYYEENKGRYGENEPEFERVKSDMQMEMGVAKYEERLSKLKAEYAVSISQ